MNSTRPPKVFISRTTAGLKDLADEIAALLRTRPVNPCEVIIQTGFLPDWRTVPQMLQEQIKNCDAVIALIGPAHGGEPDFEPARLNDQRTHDRKFSFTQWEYLVARDLKRRVFSFLLSGDDLIAPYEEMDSQGHPLPPVAAAERARRQQQFIADFPMQQPELRHAYTGRQQLLDHIRAIEFEIDVLAAKPANLPYASLGTLFKGRDEFLEQLRVQLTSDAAAIIKGHRTIHGMGGVGKTRAAIEYAWRNAEKYNALLFVSADSQQALQRNLAALCGPLVLNLPEQNEKDQNLQVEAALKWLALHPGWFLIIDNVDTEDAALETKALLERLSAGHVVITSRLSDWKGEVKALDLDVLSDAASIDFLNERTADRRAPQPDDDATVARLVRVLDCLALALEQAGALISHERLSYARYLEMWESARPTALAWHDEEKMKYPRSLAVTYETSVAQLSNAAQEFFRQLSWLAPDPLPRSTLDALPNPPDARRSLSELDSLHLVRFQKDGKSFTVHRLVQEITRQKQTEPLPPPALETALRWMNGCFVGDPDDVQSWPTLDPLAPHAETVAWLASGHAIAEPTAELMNNVAMMLYTKAKHQEAEPLLRRALEIDEASFGKDHPNVAANLNNLAQLLQTTNRPAEAEPLMRRALAINEASSGHDDPTLADNLNNLAHLLWVTNRLVEAEPLMRRALSIWETSLGQEHPLVAIAVNNLAQLLQDENRLVEAEPLMRRALSIVETSFGKDHPNVAIRLNNLAQLLKDTNRLAEALPLFERGLQINEASLGPDHPSTALAVASLASAYKATNRFAEAEPLMRRALAIGESSLGKDHPLVATYLGNLARLLQDKNRMAEAEPLTRRALAIDEASFDRNHPAIAFRLNNLAVLLKDTNRRAEATPLMRQAVLILLRFTLQTGHPHQNLSKMLNNYVSLLKEWKGDEAVMPTVLSLSEEAGIPEAQFHEILAQAFGG
ncbi:MAG: tetratricopeptide repeat protein [Verrucomicrobiaceae bacterium]|nr:tetratricopeptide repeat protein [Verrucomicrobiaceae bacterium]